MADMVTVQELENAKIDARTIGESVNENKIVTPRYGAPFKSMPMIAEEMQSIIGTIIAGGVPASIVADASGKSQQEINDRLSYMTYMRLHVSYFGVVGDGVVDDTAALKAAISFIEANDLTYLDTTDMKMLCSETIHISKPFVFGGQNSAIVGNHTNTVLRCYPSTTNNNFYDEANNKNLELNIGAMRTSYTDVATARGIEVWNCHGGRFTIQTLKNHYDGLYLSADAEQGFTYCEVFLGKITNCSGGLVLADTYNNPVGNRGWNTENTFHGGSFSSSDSTVKPFVRYHIKFEGHATGWNNHNLFIKPSFEGWMKDAMLLQNTMHNMFISPRFEMPELTNMYITSGLSKANRIVDGFGSVDFISENKYTDSLNAMSIDGFSWIGNKSRGFNFVSGAIYEYVADDETQYFRNSTARKHSTVGRKSVKNIVHTISGALTLDLLEADVFLIAASSNITSINFSNAGLLTTQQEKTIVFTQENAVNISGLTTAQLGNFALPTPRLYGTDTYIVRKTRQGSSATLAIIAHHTNNPVYEKTVLTINHTISGALNLDLSQAKRFYVRVNANITSLAFINIASVEQLESIRVFFRQDVASDITILAAYLGDKTNPVNRANGYDIYDFVKLFAGANDGFRAIAKA